MPKPSGGSFVGLDIGSQTIKVVEARGSGAGLQISAMGIENTPPGAVQGGMVVDPKALGATIKSLLSKSGVGSKRSISAAAGTSSVVVRVIEVPRMTPSELAEAMKWEIERHIPFAPNEVETAYQPIEDATMPPDPNNPNMEVLLAVAQRDMVSAHLETLQAAGLNPVAIDVEPLAAGRALVNLSRSGLAAKNVVVVNIGASNTDVGIFKNGILRFPRTIPLAGDNFTRAIAEHFGMGMEAAEEEKRENAAIFMDVITGGGSADFGAAEMDASAGAGGGRTPFDVPVDTPFDSPFGMPSSPAPSSAADASPFGEVPAAPAYVPNPDDPFALPPDEPAATPFAPAPPVSSAAPPAAIPDDPRARRRREVFDALLPVLGEFVAELRRSIDYFRSRYPADTVDQIILCGGSARIPNLDQFIQTDLGIATMVANPFAGINVSSRQLSNERLSEIAPAFAVAVGLAARDAVIGPDK